MPAHAAPIRCICLTGPTATGKTELALALAEALPAEIVSMDSAMVYRGMDVGTAKPDAGTLARVRHHLIDIRDPEEPYSAGQFATDAGNAIRAAQSRGKVALVVGGTMLYLRALREGLAALPARDEAVRAAIDAEAAVVGWAAMHAKLESVDPTAAARIRTADRQRIQRALEVHALTGRPLSVLQAEAAAAPGLALTTFALVPQDRERLRRRIGQRFEAMLAAGFLDEVQALRARPELSAASPAMRAVGYRQLWAYLAGDSSWEEARQRAVTATRQLAKRQLTWLRGDTISKRLESEDPALERRLRAGIERALGQ